VVALLPVSSWFQSTPSGGKATLRNLMYMRDALVSIHAFRGEGDHLTATTSIISLGFNPRLPGGRRPENATPAYCLCGFQSTPSGGKATEERVEPDCEERVSIHAFRGEGD